MERDEPRGGRPAGPRDARAVCAALGLPGIQPHERRGVRHHRRSSNEGLGLLQRRGKPAAAEGGQGCADIAWGTGTSSSIPAPAPSVSRAPAWTSTPEGSARAMRSTGWSRSSNRRAFASRSCPHRAAASTAWARRQMSHRAGRSRFGTPRDPSAVATQRRPREHVAFHVRQLRKVLLGGRPNLLAHRRPANGLPRAGDVGRFRPRATDDRQRGLDETVLHQRPRLGVGAQACRVPGVLL